MIFYLGNEALRRDDGGETGLYRSAADSVSKPSAGWPPESNSLLAFEFMPL